MPGSTDADDLQHHVVHRLGLEIVVAVFFMLPQDDSSHVASDIGDENTFSILQNVVNSAAEPRVWLKISETHLRNLDLIPIDFNSDLPGEIRKSPVHDVLRSFSGVKDLVQELEVKQGYLFRDFLYNF